MVAKTTRNQKTSNQEPDVWGIIDEVEEEYTDLIDELESDPRAHRHPKMKVTGMSIREIPRIQATRRTKGKGKK